MFDFYNNYTLIKYIIVAVIPLTIFLLIWGVFNTSKVLPNEDRVYFDPLPGKLKIIWPIVNFFAFYIGQNFSVDFLERYSETMKRAGVAYMMTPEQFVGLRFTSAVISIIIYVFSSTIIDSFSWTYLILVAVLGYYLPLITLRDLRTKRETQIIKALPTYLDYLTMSVQAGLNLSGSIAQASEKGPDGPLKIEFLKLVRDMRAGMGRVEAMKAMSTRLNIGVVSTFVSAVVQAEKTGSDVGATLQIQSDQRRTERFQRAEKLAMQAPVKLIFPLVAFIFPITFLIIFFPIGVKLLDVF